MAFIRTVKTRSSSGQVHEYVRIVEAYFEAGQRKQRVLANLGNLVSLRKDIKQIVKGLLRVTGEEPLFFKEDLQNERVQEYGLVYVAQKLWGYLELGEAISKSLKAQKVQLDYERWIKMMVTNKLSDPTSKLGILEWLKGVWWPDHGFAPQLFNESLAPEEQEKLLKKEVMKFYRALDHLLKMKKPLEKHLYLRLRDLFSLKVDLVFYDVTSSYFEGQGPASLAKEGYSRDNEPGKKQVLIGLILCNSLPIGHEVFEGNRVDKKTLKEILAKLKEEFEIDRCILVGDRGLISKENLEELEKQDFESILALRKRRNREVKKVLKEGAPIYCRTSEQLEYREVKKEDGLRYILCRNPEVAISQHRERQEDLAHLQAQLEQLKEKVASQKRPALKRVIRQVEEILAHRHGHRFFNYRLEGKGRALTYFRKEEALALEKELDGLYILRTREPELEAGEIIQAYRDLADVERAFRTMKSVLDLRPFFHRTEDRVRAHVFICVLAYLLEKLMEKALQRAQMPLSAEKALSSLKQVGVAVMKVGQESYGYVSEPTYRQRQVLAALDIPLPSRVLVPQKLG